mgnify:CR=1 FL=1
MSKKRTNRTRRAPAAVARRAERPAAAAAPAEPSVPAVTPGRPTAPDLREEYRYVITDLKRIGITAASMFVLLAVVALVLT